MITDTAKKAYDEWVELLKHTKNESMQSSSYDVWIEAFQVGCILTKAKLLESIQTEMQLGMSEEFDDQTKLSVTDVKQLQASDRKSTRLNSSHT